MINMIRFNTSQFASRKMQNNQQEKAQNQQKNINLTFGSDCGCNETGFCDAYYTHQRHYESALSAAKKAKEEGNMVKYEEKMKEAESHSIGMSANMGD